MNTLRYGSLVVQIAARSFSQRIIDEVQGIAFCEQALSCIEADEEKGAQRHFSDKRVDHTQTKLLIGTQVALLELTREVDGAFAVAKAKLEEIEAAMAGSVRACAPLVYSRYHLACARLWASRQLGDALPSDVSWTAMFYRHAMSYLGYTALEQVDDARRWAHDIALAALVAPDFYDFGQLSLHPIMAALSGSESQWVLDVVQAYIAADVAAYQAVAARHSSRMAQCHVLRTARAGILTDKIRLLGLVRLAFDKASFERIISFGEIERVTQCEARAVELLIMKAMSLKLLKGVVDEIEQTVQVTWVKPAILDMQQMRALLEKTNSWIAKIEATQKEIAQ